MKNQKKIKESIPFTTTTKRITYLGINLPKETKELYTENCKTLMKEIKGDINRWRYIPGSWVGRIDIVKMTTLPNAVYRFNAIPINYQWHFSQNRNKKFHNSYGNTKDLSSQSSLQKEEWSWRNQASWLQTILQSYSHQDSMVLAQKQKYRPMKPDRKPRNKPMHIWVLYFWQRKQEYTMGQRQFF